MSSHALIAMLLMAAAGAMMAVQAPINAALARGIGSTIGAATISFAVGFVLLLIATLILGDGLSLLKMGQVPVWLLVGGALGAVYVFSAVWSVPILGVVTTTALMIFGQMSAALLLDHFGAFGLAHQSITPQRLAAAALVAGGVILSRW